jgi:hypothetical protein
VITKADRIYYVNPIGSAIVPKDWTGAKVLVTAVRYPRPDVHVGDIVSVNGKYIDDKATFWYTTTDGGRHVEGQLLSENNYSPYTRQRIAFVGDELFASGVFVDRDDETNQFRMQVQRWSNPAMPINLNSEYGVFNEGCLAAPWAQDLMPRPGESAEVVVAKVEQARTRWEHKRKAVAIVREGHIRGWLNLLEGLNEQHLSYMGFPRFDLHVEGKALVPVGSIANAEVVAQARRHLERQGATLEIPDSTPFFVSTPYTAMIHAGFTHEALKEADASQAFRNHVRRDIGDYSLDATLDDHRYVLTTLNN